MSLILPGPLVPNGTAPRRRRLPTDWPRHVSSSLSMEKFFSLRDLLSSLEELIYNRAC